jgi:transposase
MFNYFQFNREEFLTHYHARSNSESTFGALKAKFNDHLKSKTLTAQKNELLLKILCFNIVQVIHETNELGITANFESV